MSQAPLPLTRREFIRQSTGGGLGFLAFSGFAPSFLSQSAAAQNPAPGRDQPILVIIQLGGGNDGLNTVIPFNDDNYFRLRPNLALRDNIIPISDQLALHPSLGQFQNLLNEGQLGIIQNVGYPNPSRSHFRSTEIWETASDSDGYSKTGWLGRYIDNNCSGKPENVDPSAIHIGDIIPQSYLTDNPASIFGIRSSGQFNRGKSPADEAYESILEASHTEGNASYLQQTMMNVLVTERRVEAHLNKYKTSVNYPTSKLGQSLKRIAALIHADMETRVYYVSQSGYDTHSKQLDSHAELLTDLADSMAAFQRDLIANNRDDQVLTMTFSEFGRRPAENGSAGTDHGTAAPLFVMGKAIKGGIHGQSPDLNIDPKEDPVFSTDFRGVYNTVLDKWMQADADTILGEKFDPVQFL
jgi:uncharacterized protein (DUF1501 family)